MNAATSLSSRSAEPALSWMIIVSAIFHLAVLVAVVLLPRELFDRPPPPVIAYTVKLVDQSALGGRLPKGELRPEIPPSGVTNLAAKEEPKAPPEPEPPKPQEKVVKLPEVPPKPAPKPEPEKKQVEAKKPPATPAPSKAELAKIERDKDIRDAIKHLGEKGNTKKAAGLGGQEEGKGAALGTGGDGGGGGVLMGLDFIIYKNRVEAIIKKNWTWVGANPDLTIRVGFRIGDDGQIVDVRVLGNSGDSSYDDSVMRAVRISSPLPPPPEKYREIFGNYTLEFLSGQLAAGG